MTQSKQANPCEVGGPRLLGWVLAQIAFPLHACEICEKSDKSRRVRVRVRVCAVVCVGVCACVCSCVCGCVRASERCEKSATAREMRFQSKPNRHISSRSKFFKRD